MINTKKYIVLTMVAVLVFFTGCKDKNTQVSLTDKAENNSQTTRVEAGSDITA
jgi:competence protein ComEA